MDFQQLTISDAIDQLRECWSAKTERAVSRYSDQSLSIEEMRTTGIVCVCRRITQISYLADKPSPGSCVHYDVGPDWANFHARLTELQNAISNGLAECLETGRILTVEERAGGATLFAPWQWKGQKLKKHNPVDRYFLFSGDLPSNWIKKSPVLKGKEREDAVEQVRKVLQREYAKMLPQHIRLTRGEFEILVFQKLGFGVRIVDDAWSVANIPKWKEGGRPKQTDENPNSKTEDKT